MSLQYLGLGIVVMVEFRVGSWIISGGLSSRLGIKLKQG
jgi:hypothetical protein